MISTNQHSLDKPTESWPKVCSENQISLCGCPLNNNLAKIKILFCSILKKKKGWRRLNLCLNNKISEVLLKRRN